MIDFVYICPHFTHTSRIFRKPQNMIRINAWKILYEICNEEFYWNNFLYSAVKKFAFKIHKFGTNQLQQYQSWIISGCVYERERL